MTKTAPALLAEDDEDLQIISAQLQDAVAHLGDLVYLPRARRFAGLFNRFRWEDCKDAKDRGLRVRAGLHFDGVLGAKSYKLKRDVADAVVELLAIQFVPGKDGAGVIELLFAGGGAIRLQVECMNATLRDMSGPWPARAQPQHDHKAER
jgi:hypothetical protein